MAGFDVIRHATYQEVVIEGNVTLPLLREVLDQIAKDDDWFSLNVLWLFGADIRPPAFHEFDDIIAMVDKLYVRRPTGKRVALVVLDSFTLSVATVFQGLAVRLPVQMRIFDDPEAARAWVEV